EPWPSPQRQIAILPVPGLLVIGRTPALGFPELRRMHVQAATANWNRADFKVEHFVKYNRDEHVLRHVGGVENIMNSYSRRRGGDARQHTLDCEAPGHVVVGVPEILS